MGSSVDLRLPLCPPAFLSKRFLRLFGADILNPPIEGGFGLLGLSCEILSLKAESFPSRHRSAVTTAALLDR
jgi:hypothetical protein